MKYYVDQGKAQANNGTTVAYSTVHTPYGTVCIYNSTLQSSTVLYCTVGIEKMMGKGRKNAKWSRFWPKALFHVVGGRHYLAPLARTCLHLTCLPFAVGK
jgi:hypothetical protein